MNVQYDVVTGAGRPLYEAVIEVGSLVIEARGHTYSDALTSLLLRLEEHARLVAQALEATRTSTPPATPEQWD